jgi:decaprenyl-phosphate phosphoribosyltransferase
MKSEESAIPNGPQWSGHLAIMRVDHWVKNVFVIPGTVGALTLVPGQPMSLEVWLQFLFGMVAICLVASSYYTLNEVLDAPSDRDHPVKRLRPVPSGQVNIPLAYLQWLGLGAIAITIGFRINWSFGTVIAALWIMGCLYNIRPIRTKDVPYLDVLSEALNNPLRLLAGWFAARPDSVPPLSLLVSYWFVGCYFMAIKRFAEFKEIADPQRAAAYRRSFAFYSERRLLTSIMFYGTAAMLFLGVFTVRYRLELILAYPFVALVMAIYLDIAFEPNSAAQAPEKLHRVPRLMISTAACALVIGALCFVDLPWIHHAFLPSFPTIHQ